MRTTLVVARKELGLYFATPVAYVIFAGMAFLSAIWFVGGLGEFLRCQQEARAGAGAGRLAEYCYAYRNLTDGVVVPTMETMVVITLFAGPFLAMRLFAEERRHKTIELLMTTPIRPVEIVLGKFLGGAGAIVATLSITIVFPVILSAYGASESGSAIEWPTVLLAYGTLLAWGTTCIAVGMFLSSLTESQGLAGILTLVVLLPFWILEFVVGRLNEPLRSIISHITLSEVLGNSMRGVLDLKAVVTLASVIALMLVLTHRSVEARRWM